MELKKLGDFEIIREVGRGGMGVVYEAIQVSLGRRVALKVILGLGRSTTLQIERFRREASAAAGLAHPNITQVFAFGEAGGNHYIAMEFVDGRGFDELLADPSLQPVAHAVSHVRMPPPPDANATERIVRETGEHAALEAPDAASSESPPDALLPPRATGVAPRTGDVRRFCAIVMHAARALHAAHEQGVLHRDIKPANILLGPGDVVKLADFGLARHEAHGETITSSGEVMGTLAYLCPEQLGAVKAPATRQGDIYALGITLYEALTGARPFAATTAAALMRAIQVVEPVPPRRIAPAVPRDLEVICLKSIEKNPLRRYATAGALADDIERFLIGEPILARAASPLTRVVKFTHRRRTPLLVGTLLVVFGAAALFFWRVAREERKTEASQKVELKTQQTEMNRKDARHAFERSLAGSLGGQSASVIAYLSEAIRLDPTLIEAYLLRGLQYGSAGEAQKALADFNTGLKLKPDDIALRYARGTLFRLLGREADAAADLDGISLVRVDDPIRLTALGIFQVIAGRNVAALDSLAAARRLEPSAVLSRFGMALAQYRLRRYDDAAETVKLYLEYEPRNLIARAMSVFTRHWKIRLARGQMRDDLLAEGRRLQAESAALAPDDPLVHAACASLDAVDDSPTRPHTLDACIAATTSLLERAAETDLQISGSTAYEMLAVIQIERDAPRARILAERAIKLRRNSPLARMVIGRLDEAAGDLPAAVSRYRVLHSDYPELPDVNARLLTIHQTRPDLVPADEARGLALQLVNDFQPQEPEMLTLAAAVLVKAGSTPVARDALTGAERIARRLGNDATAAEVHAKLAALPP